MATRIAQIIRNKKKPAIVTVAMAIIAAVTGVVPSVGMAVIAGNIPMANMTTIGANDVVAEAVTVVSGFSIMATCACWSLP